MCELRKRNRAQVPLFFYETKDNKYHINSKFFYERNQTRH